MPATNLLMFSLDDMRSLDDWGHFSPLVVTPNMDRLAAAGTTFERAVTQVPLCNPSRTSVLTGQQPSKTGILDNDIPWFERVDPASTLPAVLKAAGAHVAMYGKHFHSDTIGDDAKAVMFDEFVPRFNQGFAGQVIDDELRHQGPFPLKAGRYGGPATDLADELTAQAAVDFLRSAGELTQPFMLGVGISKPHLNWWVPGEFYDLYDPAAIRAALELSLQDGTIIPGEGEYFDVPPMAQADKVHAPMAADLDLWADYIHAYLASISYADAKIGAVLDALEADPALAADTAILLWSDHGFHLGDKDRWLKFTQWRESTEVPLILVDPDQVGGQRAEQVVSLVDVFPTVLDLMGITPPPELALDGNSLLPIVQDIAIDWYDPAAGKGVALTAIYGSVSIRAHIPGVGDLRYTRYPDGTAELYDLTNDPGEHVNRINFATGAGLTPEDDLLHASMRELMDQQLLDAGILVSNGVDPVVGTDADELLSGTRRGGVNILEGGGGDDTYVLYGPGATIVEAADGGFDTVVLRGGAVRNFVIPEHVEVISVAGGFTGDDKANIIFSGGSASVLDGGGGDDRINAGQGADTVFGGLGNDHLIGDIGADVLHGGLGSDTLEGRQGADIFRYTDVAESTPEESDLILGFNGAGRTGSERIDLSAIDADPTLEGDQAFRLGSGEIGSAWFVDEGLDTLLLANLSGDALPELRIVIRDGVVQASAYTIDDVIL